MGATDGHTMTLLKTSSTDSLRPTRNLRYSHSNFGGQSEVVTRHLESSAPDLIDSYLWLCFPLYFFDTVKCQVDGVFIDTVCHPYMMFT
jgi:hypothetical protein